MTTKTKKVVARVARNAKKLPRRKPKASIKNRPSKATRKSSGKGSGRTRVRVPKKSERVRLELIRLEADRKKNFGNKLLGRARVTWDVYFVFAVEHPDDPAKSIVWTYPERPIDMKKAHDNEISFGKKGGAGATVLECAMPDDRRLTARCYVMQSKSKSRRTGEVMSTVSKFVDGEVAPLASKAAAKSGNAHAVIAVEAGKVLNKGIGVVGQLLAGSKDKQRGFGSLEHQFRKTNARQKKPMRIDLGDSTLLVRWSTYFV